MRDGPIRSTPNAADPPADPLVGRVIAGKFAVQERLGAGAMGIVYRATQLALERTVAIKVLHREFAADADFADRFWREAKAASRLDHPNSIRVFDFGQESDGLLYLAMEYVEGCDLFELISERGLLRPASIVDVLCQVLAALAVAHDMAVVHRDLKPENIMIVRGKSDDGQPIDVVKVCDFGIAKLLDTAAASEREPRRKHSTTGLVVGTPAYMSPEQARGEKLDARSDLYSVGVVLYELLTGKVPFEGESVLAVALKHVSDNPVAPSSRSIGVDPDLEAICVRAMSKKPADRYQSAREMRLALQSVASKAGFGVQSSPFIVSPRGSRPARHDSSKPTFAGVTPATPPPRSKRTRAWLAMLVVPVASAWAFSHFHAASGGERSTAGPGPSSSPSAPVVAPAAADLAAETTAPTSASPEVTPAAGAHQAAGGKHHHVKGEAAPPAAEQDSIANVAPAPPVPAPAPVVEALAAPPAVTPPPPPQPATPAPAPPPLAPAAPAYDLQAARVVIGSARNAVGATAASVTRAVSEASSRITACYKAALPQLSGTLEGAGVLHIDTDGAGIITDARLSGPIRGSVASCVAAAVQGHRVANVDTGNASGDVPLSFRAH